MSEFTSARELLLHSHHGVLSTHSAKEPGYPYGSLLPFCLGADGQPLGLISELAQHTRNLRQNPKASLTLFQAAESDQIQAGPRLVLLGEAYFLSPAESEQLAPRYYRYLPSSPDYRLLNDFCFVSLQTRRLHYIAGFGQIRWLEASEVLKASPFLPLQENAMLEDLNTREAELLAAIWHKACGSAASEPVAIAGLDGDGGDLRQGSRLLRFDFMSPVADLEQAWHRLHAGEVRANG